VTSRLSLRTFDKIWLAALVAIACWSILNIGPVGAESQLAASISPDTVSQIEESTAALPAERAVSNWEWLALAFATVFVAEMGDKTQLATMLMSAQEKSPWMIFLGSSAGLVAASLVSVTLGGWLSQFLPPQALQILAGASFIVIGIVVLWREIESEKGIEESHGQEE
jgi:putative Ca2+/H+ antiporter (TMEM165/GDT1 family)